MRHVQQQFPIEVRTGWVDYSPALRDHASERIRSLLAEFAPQIRSVTVQISNDPAQSAAQRRCDIEVTTDSGPIAASSVGAELFTLVERAVNAVVDVLRQRSSGKQDGLLRRRIA